MQFICKQQFFIQIMDYKKINNLENDLVYMQNYTNIMVSAYFFSPTLKCNSPLNAISPLSIYPPLKL